MMHLNAAASFELFLLLAIETYWGPVSQTRCHPRVFQLVQQHAAYSDCLGILQNQQESGLLCKFH